MKFILDTAKMKKIVAISDGDIISFEYGEIIWKIAPLPFGIKKQLTKRSAEAVSKKDGVADLVDVALDAIRYGLKGWEGLRFSNGEDVKFSLTKDKAGYERLDEKSIEILYKTSAFDKLASYCLQPDAIPEYMINGVDFSEVKNNISSPESLVEEKKNS